MSIPARCRCPFSPCTVLRSPSYLHSAFCLMADPARRHCWLYGNSGSALTRTRKAISTHFSSIPCTMVPWLMHCPCEPRHTSFKWRACRKVVPTKRVPTCSLGSGSPNVARGWNRMWCKQTSNASQSFNYGNCAIERKWWTAKVKDGQMRNSLPRHVSKCSFNCIDHRNSKIGTVPISVKVHSDFCATCKIPIGSSCTRSGDKEVLIHRSTTCLLNFLRLRFGPLRPSERKYRPSSVF